MRRALLLLGGLLAASTLWAAVEISADEMRDAEDLLKSLDSNVSLKQPKALEEARHLARYFQQVEAHYAAQTDAVRGAEFARGARQQAEAAAQAVSAGDYDAAFDAVDALQRSCKQCHQVYKAKK